MWAEPLTAAVTRTHASMFVVTVSQDDPRSPTAHSAVAHVVCSISPVARCGYFGDMVLDSKDGAPRQVQRALVLLVRTALAYAESQGITHVETDIPKDASPSLRAFARRMAGRDENELGTLSGELFAIRSWNLDRTNADGTEKDSPPPATIDELRLFRDNERQASRDGYGVTRGPDPVTFEEAADIVRRLTPNEPDE